MRERARKLAVREVKSGQSEFVNSLAFIDRFKLAIRLMRRKF